MSNSPTTKREKIKRWMIAIPQALGIVLIGISILFLSAFIYNLISGDLTIHFEARNLALKIQCQ